MSYIGNEPIVSATRTITELTATAGQTVFVANGGYTVGYIDVFLNGAQLQTSDFTASNGSSITLTEAAQVGDVIRLVAWGTFSTSTAVLRAGDTMTGALLLPDGSASAPALSNDGDNNTGIFFPAADTIAFSEGGTEAMRIDSSGNVGIGTSSPNYKMTVNGGASATAIQLVNTSSGTGAGDGLLIYQDGVDSRVQNTEVGNLTLWTGNNERMRIDSSGNLLVGTTSNPDTARIVVNSAGASGVGLSVYGGNVIQSINKSAADAGICYFAARDTSGYIGYWTRAGAFVGGITVTASGTTYATSSDYRLKENVAPMTGALGVVQKLKPVTYTWKADGSAGQGFIAHELQEVVPDCVTGKKDAVDDEGNPKYQGIDTSFLVATLTAAIQEQQAIITDLKQRIETLESK